ncbi:MAG: hypothetical protein R3E10_11590 [Gemmatimonadota bacterium]
MLRRLGIRWWVQMITCIACTAAAALTLAFPAWVESTFDLAPDGGSGAFEVLLLVGFAGVAVALAVAAHGEARKRLSLTA